MRSIGEPKKGSFLQIIFSSSSPPPSPPPSPSRRRCGETFVSLRGHKLESSPQRLDLPKTRKIPGFVRQKEFASPSQQMIPPPPTLQTDENTKDFNASDEIVKKPDLYIDLMFAVKQSGRKCGASSYTF